MVAKRLLDQEWGIIMLDADIRLLDWCWGIKMMVVDFILLQLGSCDVCRGYMQNMEKKPRQDLYGRCRTNSKDKV